MTSAPAKGRSINIPQLLGKSSLSPRAFRLPRWSAEAGVDGGLRTNVRFPRSCSCFHIWSSAGCFQCSQYCLPDLYFGANISCWEKWVLCAGTSLAWKAKPFTNRSLTSCIVRTGRRRRNFRDSNNHAEEKLVVNNTRCTEQLGNSVFTCMLQQMPHKNNFFFFF